MGAHIQEGRRIGNGKTGTHQRRQRAAAGPRQRDHEHDKGGDNHQPLPVDQALHTPGAHPTVIEQV